LFAALTLETEKPSEEIQRV